MEHRMTIILSKIITGYRINNEHPIVTSKANK